MGEALAWYTLLGLSEQVPDLTAQGQTSPLGRASLQNLNPFMRLYIVKRKGEKMVREGTGRLFRRPDGKYMLYLPVDLCQDSGFPFKLSEANPSIKMRVTWEGDKIIAMKKS